MEWLLAAITIIVGLCSFGLGYNAGADRGHKQAIKGVMKYVQETMPNVWAAYKKGVNEGYEQGLADANAGPGHEPA